MSRGTVQGADSHFVKWQMLQRPQRHHSCNACDELPSSGALFIVWSMPVSKTCGGGVVATLKSC